MSITAKKFIRPHLGSCSRRFVIYRAIKQAKSQTENIVRNAIVCISPWFSGFGEDMEDLVVPVSKLLL